MTQASRPQSDNLSAYPFPSDPGPYSGDQWASLFAILFTGDQQATQGPFIRYLNELEVTDNGSTTVSVGTGAGMVNGHALISSEQETWTIPAGPAGGRTDRVVMVENNTNVEVTQSTAGRPLLFPADLSEYTATPGVPAYSARLAILRGNDAGALPALDQATTLFMVELARYDINNVPTISNATDYREFCYFSSTVGMRKFLIPCVVAYNDTDATDLFRRDFTRGTPLPQAVPDNKNCYASSSFVIPTDFQAALTVTTVVHPMGASGNIYGWTRVRYSQCGENWNTHQHSPAASAVAITTPRNNCIWEVALTNAGGGDIVNIQTFRNGANALDTVGDVVFLVGWLVTYQAKS